MNGIRFLHESYFYSQHSNIFFYKQLKTTEKLTSYREKSESGQERFGTSL